VGNERSEEAVPVDVVAGPEAAGAVCGDVETMAPVFLDQVGETTLNRWRLGGDDLVVTSEHGMVGSAGERPVAEVDRPVMFRAERQEIRSVSTAAVFPEHDVVDMQAVAAAAPGEAAGPAVAALDRSAEPPVGESPMAPEVEASRQRAEGRPHLGRAARRCGAGEQVCGPPDTGVTAQFFERGGRELLVRCGADGPLKAGGAALVVLAVCGDGHMDDELRLGCQRRVDLRSGADQIEQRIEASALELAGLVVRVVVRVVAHRPARAVARVG